MASDLYDAKIDGIALEIQEINDGWTKAIAEYEYPYRDGADTEDMGQRSRRSRWRCYFWDDFAAHNTYDAHVALLNHLRSQELFEFVHPTYGPTKGRICSVNVRQDDRIRHAEIDIEFVQQMPSGDIRAIPYRNIRAAMETSYFGVITAAIVSVQTRISAFTRQFTAPVKRFMAGIERCTMALDATINVIANPANSLVAAVNYGMDLPSRLVQSSARCSERYARLYDTMQSAPTRFCNSLSGSLSLLSASFSGSAASVPDGGGTVYFGTGVAATEAASIVSGAVQVVSAAHLAYETASIYQDDQETWIAQKNAEGIQTFDALGNYTPVDAAPIMTVGELEKTLFDVRSAIQGAIDYARAYDVASAGTGVLEGLKALAFDLESHVASVKLEREKIITVELDNPMPLHLVCLKYGLDYHAAERLIAINPKLRNPNRASGKVAIYAR